MTRKKLRKIQAYFYNIKSGISGKKIQVFFQLQYALKNTKTEKFLTGEIFGPQESISLTVLALSAS